jgi:glycosyltransferase involved in cell wall biosynthesis
MGNTNLLISAVICTLNRANYLYKALQSLVAQTLSPDRYEIIVVDNGSTDNTKQVVSEEFTSFAHLRYLYEPIMGLSQARNTGWQNAKGKYIAYLDDDAIAAPQWLEKIVEVYETVQPQPACVGGKVEPIWEIPKPDWLPDNLLNFYTISNCSETPIVLNNNQWLVGANISFPRKILEELGSFKTGLGRVGNKLLSMEENFIQEELRKKGYSCFYHPEIAVKHLIPATRLTQDWMLQRNYWEGISAAIYRIQKESPSMRRRWRIGLSQTRNLLASPKELVKLLLPTENPQRFRSKCSTLMQIGYISGIVGFVK